MPVLLQNPARMPAHAHASNGARLVSTAGHVLPLRRIELTCEAFGGIARTRLLQHFSNKNAHPLELTYTFPLPADGTVSGYEIRAGNRVIRGRVERRDEARAQYEAARLEGRTAGLVEQERSNLFTQYLGNIPATTDVIVELTIDQLLRWVPGYGWEWRFPTVVAPRYLGAEGVVRDADRVTVDVVNGVTSPTASVALTIAEDLSIAPTSPTHRIVVTDRSVALAADAALDRDIVIRWAVARQSPGCSIRTMRPAASQATIGDAAYGLLTIVPPTGDGPSFARDLVLLLDVSGSMSGKPLEHLKAVVTSVIDSLGDDDRVEIIAFSSNPVRFHEEPARATAAERQRAREWVQRLKANGGTELIPAIEEALRPLRSDVPRQVVVVTDGLIGFEASAVRAIRDRLPRGSRLHTVGVGSASNRAFLRPAARAGRGLEVLIDLDEPATHGAERIVATTREPVVIDVAIEGTALQAAAPRLPDLLSGSPVLATLRVRPEGGTLVVRGVTPQGTWEERLEVSSPAPGEGSEAIPALWAREAIEDLELDLACGGNRGHIDRQIEQIGVAHAISSRLTSWVAIAEEPSVDPRDPVRMERIPQALPYGMDAVGLGVDGAPRVALSVAHRASSMLDTASLLTSLLGEAFQARRERALSREESKRQRARIKELEHFRAAMDARLASVLSRRDHLIRLSESQMEEVAALRGEIHARLSKLEAERPGIDPLWEQQVEAFDRLLTDVDATLTTLESERQRMRHSWGSQFEAIDQLRERIEAAVARLVAKAQQPRPVEEQPVVLRGRIVATPGRQTTTIEIHATSRFLWRPAGTVILGGQRVTVVEQGTTRPSLIAAGSLVRLELSATSTDVARSNEIEIPSGDAVLVIELVVAG
jgi:Ca-activated chloride channel family protein